MGFVWMLGRRKVSGRDLAEKTEEGKELSCLQSASVKSI